MPQHAHMHCAEVAQSCKHRVQLRAQSHTSAGFTRGHCVYRARARFRLPLGTRGSCVCQTLAGNLRGRWASRSQC